VILALDLDGTLITAKAKQVALIKAIAARYDLTLEGEAFWRLKQEGARTRDALTQLGLAPALAQRLHAAWAREIETTAWQALDTLFPDTLDALTRLRQQDHTLILLTARANALLMRQQVFRLGLAPFFADLHSVGPSRAAAEKAALLTARRCEAFIGDTESDAAAASTAALPFHAVATGQRSAAFLKRVGLASIHMTLNAALKALASESNTLC
jgi:phosphoglycolate phosphatase-like HAD superfamily hydrolase